MNTPEDASPTNRGAIVDHVPTTNERPTSKSNGGPALLLLSGVVLAILGVGLYGIGSYRAFLDMDLPDDSSKRDFAMQSIGFWLVPCGVLMVLFSITWLIIRFSRR